MFDDVVRMDFSLRLSLGEGKFGFGRGEKLGGREEEKWAWLDLSTQDQVTGRK